MKDGTGWRVRQQAWERLVKAESENPTSREPGRVGTGQLIGTPAAPSPQLHEPSTGPGRGAAHLDPQQVVHGGDDDIHGGVVAGLSSQIILKICTRPKNGIKSHSRV